MAQIPLNQKIRTIDASVDTTERQSKLINSKSEVYTLADIVSTVSSNQVAVENTAMTGTVNLDLLTFDSYEGTLTGNTVLTVSNRPGVGQTFVRTVAITSTTTETLQLPVAWNLYGSYVADGTRNVLTINFSSYPVAGLIVDCFINQPS